MKSTADDAPRLKLADTRLGLGHQEDLRWFYEEAPGRLGLQSSHGALVSRAMSGGPSSSDADHDGIAVAAVHAATRERKIRRVLDALPARHRLTLRAAFDVEAPAVRRDWAGLGTVQVSATLMLLTAHREGVTRKQLRAWITPPKGEPESDDLPASERMAVRGRNAERLRAWRAEVGPKLSELRGEAQVSLLAASLAYQKRADEERESRRDERPRFVGRD